MALQAALSFSPQSEVGQVRETEPEVRPELGHLQEIQSSSPGTSAGIVSEVGFISQMQWKYVSESKALLMLFTNV